MADQPQQYNSPINPGYTPNEIDNSFKQEMITPSGKSSSPYYALLKKELRIAKIPSGDMAMVDEILKKTMELCQLYIMMDLPELADQEWSIELARLNITVSEEGLNLMRQTAANIASSQTIIQKEPKK